MPLLLLPGLKTPPCPPSSAQEYQEAPGGTGGHTADVFPTSRLLCAHRPPCLLQHCLPAKHKALPRETARLKSEEPHGLPWHPSWGACWLLGLPGDRAIPEGHHQDGGADPRPNPGRLGRKGCGGCTCCTCFIYSYKYTLIFLIGMPMQRERSRLQGHQRRVQGGP